MGLWKGKKGSTVFYRVTNSNNREVQGEREYRAEISNPQSNAQANQRLKMLPAQLLAGALRPIISRSFQGIQYGAKSRLAFRKYALTDAGQIPYIRKGSIQPAPGEYLIAKGTLQPINCTPSDDYATFITDLVLPGPFDEEMTIGELSARLLSANPNLQAGDQLTFVVCSYRGGAGEDMQFVWYYYSIDLDTEATEVLVNLPYWSETTISATNNQLVLSDDQDQMAAAAVIHSRKGSDGLYLRSNTRLALNSDKTNLAWLYSPESRIATRASYQTDKKESYTDWPVEPDGGETYDDSGMLRGLTGDLAQLNGQLFKLRRYESDNRIAAFYYVVASGDPDARYAIKPDGERLQYTVTQEGETIVHWLLLNQIPGYENYDAVLWEPLATRRLGLGRLTPEMAADPGKMPTAGAKTKKNAKNAK